MSERDSFYDNLKGLLIILVVLCHFLGGCVTKSDFFTRSFIVFVYYFHMPLFIFISGFFSKNPGKSRDKAFRNLFLVFVVAQVFWIVFKFIANGSVYYLYHFLDPGYAIWYIVALFFWRLLLKDLIRIPHVLLIAFLISPLVMFVDGCDKILACNKVFGFLFFFLLGYYTNADTIAKIRRIPVLAAAAGLVLLFAATCFAVKNGIMPYGLSKSVLLHTAPMAKVTAAAGSVWCALLVYYAALAVAVVSGILVIAVMPGKKTFFAAVGGDTLPLYLSHTYFLILCDLLFAAFAFSDGVKYGISLFLCAVLIVVFSTGVYRRVFHAVYDFLIGLVYPQSAEGKDVSR